jgi:hypothetical protein
MATTGNAMSIHINKFIDKIKATESRNLRDLTMSMTDARDLHADITKLLLAVQALQERGQAAAPTANVISVEVEGGTF